MEYTRQHSPRSVIDPGFGLFEKEDAEETAIARFNTEHGPELEKLVLKSEATFQKFIKHCEAEEVVLGQSAFYTQGKVDDNEATQGSVVNLKNSK